MTQRLNVAERVTTPLLVLITAPSGAGKTTVSQMLLETTPGLERVITCTTRPPRVGERDGHDYHFLSREQFERRVATKKGADSLLAITIWSSG